MAELKGKGSKTTLHIQGGITFVASSKHRAFLRYGFDSTDNASQPRNGAGGQSCKQHLGKLCTRSSINFLTRSSIMITDVPGSAGVSIPILVDPAPAAPVQEQVSSSHYEQGAPAQEQIYCFYSGAFCISVYHVKYANNNTNILILSHHPPYRSSHHNLHNPRQRHRDLLFRRTSKHHQGPASHLHHLNHHRIGICQCCHCRQQCKIFASGVNFSIFTHFLCFYH